MIGGSGVVDPLFYWLESATKPEDCKMKYNPYDRVR